MNRPITEYASPVFHDCLPAYLSKDIESIQRRAMKSSNLPGMSRVLENKIMLFCGV